MIRGVDAQHIGGWIGKHLLSLEHFHFTCLRFDFH
jgi:hypothetical protein